MKVDVEGAEPLVFAGALGTIADNPQIQIAMEWSPDQQRDAGKSPSAFAAQLASMGLQAFCFEKDLAALSWDEVAASPYANLLLKHVG
jgi:hypothetical protein